MMDSYFEKDKTFCTSESCYLCPPLYWSEVVCPETSLDLFSDKMSCKLLEADLEWLPDLDLLLNNLLVGDIDYIEELWLELRPRSGERSFVIMLNLFLNEIGAYEWID